MELQTICWPAGKNFAFTIFDDTDFATVDNVKDVYKFLVDEGFRTTKSVWPGRAGAETTAYGSTCKDQDYLAWVQALQTHGFEIGYHLTDASSSVRHDILQGLQTFADLFGHYPQSMANHYGCDECIYWGNYRLTGVHEFIYNLLTLYRNHRKSKGHIADGPFFWGDLCTEKIKYVRNFVFQDINTLKCCPFMPYYDEKRPYVNLWFASANGGNISHFNKCLTEKNQDRLEYEGGACIMYTHFSQGFLHGKQLDKQFVTLMQRLRRKNGWFVPVAVLLDYVLMIQGVHTITDQERKKLERKWLLEKVTVGTN
jgi:hypothetical protein